VWKRWSENAPAKLLSFFVAAALWLSVTNQIEFENEYVFPVEYVNRPSGLTTVQVLPSKVRASVRGKGKFLGYRLRDGVCRVDLSQYQIGQNRILFTGQDMVLPKDVAVSRVEITEPRRVLVDFDETVIRDIPITPTVVGVPSPRYTQVGKTFLSPPMARVKGPRKLVDEIALLPTVEIDIDGHKNTLRKRVRLEAPSSPTVEITPMTVDIGITIEPLVRTELAEVRLEVEEDSPVAGRVSFIPPSIPIEIEGAKSIVEIAAREMASLILSADAWSVGTSIMRFRDVRDGAVVFAPQDSFPFQDSPAFDPDHAAGTNGGPPAGPPLLPTGRVPPAVQGELTGHLSLPRELVVTAVKTDRIVVSVREKADEIVNSAE
jgi:hypothetical protein